MILMVAMIRMMDRTITCPTLLHHHRRPDHMTATLLQDLATFHHPQDRTPVMEDHDPRTRQLITPLRLEDLRDLIRMDPEDGRQMHM